MKGRERGEGEGGGSQQEEGERGGAGRSFLNFRAVYFWGGGRGSWLGVRKRERKRW